MAISEEVKQTLIFLAEKYETPSFTESDPSQFIHWYTKPEDIEIACFVAAMFSFGNRTQFIPKIRLIFEAADSSTQKSIFFWIKQKKYRSFLEKITDKDKKFYRFYSYNDLFSLFSRLTEILEKGESFGQYFRKIYFCDTTKDLGEIISEAFRGVSIVPQTKNSPKKRICMFLRWMVRQNSSVDIGLWNWYPESKLVIPLDTHVLHEAEKLGLIKKNSPASMKTATALTEVLGEVFPGDPTKADYALFGLGVNQD